MRTTYPAVDGEGETLYEGEFEEEGLGELEGLYELEDESEGEDEFESEGEDEYERTGELEFEEEDEYEAEDEYEDEDEQEDEAEFDFEAEAESEGEFEDFANPARRIYPDAELMAHLATSAAESESEAEAEAFIGALVPLAARLLPRALPLVRRIAPTFLRGAGRLVRQMRRDPGTRRLIRAVPIIVTRSLQSLTDQAANGRSLTSDRIVRTIARITSEVLGDRRSARRATNAVAVFDRRWHASQQGRLASGSSRRPARGSRSPRHQPRTNGHRRGRVTARNRLR